MILVPKPFAKMRLLCSALDLVLRCICILDRNQSKEEITNELIWRDSFSVRTYDCTCIDIITIDIICKSNTRMIILMKEKEREWEIIEIFFDEDDDDNDMSIGIFRWCVSACLRYLFLCMHRRKEMNRSYSTQISNLNSN